MLSMSFGVVGTQMFSVEMAIFVEGTLLALEYAVSPKEFHGSFRGGASSKIQFRIRAKI